MFEFGNSSGYEEPFSLDYNSLVFKVLSEKMKSASAKLNVMDFGRPHDRNIQFAHQFSCKYYVADLNSDWQLNKTKLPWYLSWTSLFPQTAEQVVLDVVICWDLLNYMDKVQLQSWYTAVKEHANKNTLLQALFFTNSQMPVNPGQYHVLHDHRIRVRFERGERACPRYNQVQLQKLMPGLVVQRSFLLQNGMQEYLFEFKDDMRPG